MPLDTSRLRRALVTHSGMRREAKRIRKRRVQDGRPRLRHLHHGLNSALFGATLWLRWQLLLGMICLWWRLMELWWPVTLPCCFAAFWVWREKIDLEDNSSFVPGCLGSRLRGGGGDTQATRARKQKETLLLAGLRELLQGICPLSGDDDDLRTSGNNAAQCNAAQGNAVQRKLAQPSKAKRRRAKRQAQEGGLIGGFTPGAGASVQ